MRTVGPYLTGSHTWDNLIDRRSKPDFDYTGYLGFLRSHNHNFIRLWTRETATQNPDDAIRDFYPLPYQRTGPGTAMDGKPKFDLTKFNPVYFSRLRSRVQEARDRGIYVMVMLFNGFSIHNKGGGRPNPGQAVLLTLGITLTGSMAMRTRMGKVRNCTLSTNEREIA